MSCPKEYLDFFHKAVAFSDKASFVIPLPSECLSDVEEESKKLGVEIKVRSRKANSMVFTRRKKMIMLYYSGIEDIYQTVEIITLLIYTDAFLHAIKMETLRSSNQR